MILSRRARLSAAAGSGVMFAIAAVGSVSAHVSIEEEAVEAGSFAVVTFSVPHGCDGSPTTQVRIQMDESIPTVTPTINANWTVDKVMEPLDTPIAGSHGEQLTERVSEVVYTAITPLADGYRDTFELGIEVPGDAVGQTLYFPTIQTCQVGETAWIEIPAEGVDGDELAAPAPSVLVVAGHDGGADEATHRNTGFDDRRNHRCEQRRVGVDAWRCRRLLTGSRRRRRHGDRIEPRRGRIGRR